VVIPWTPDDAQSHTKAANTPAKREKWAAIANSVFKKDGDEGKAIRIADAAVKGKKHPK